MIYKRTDHEMNQQLLYACDLVHMENDILKKRLSVYQQILFGDGERPLAHEERQELILSLFTHFDSEDFYRLSKAFPKEYQIWAARHPLADVRKQV